MAARPPGRRSGDSQSILGFLTGGAAGVGLVLVALPSMALVWGLSYFEGARLVGLPLLAIFGIMILFGTLALVAMLFQSMELADARMPLALPEGSIRAAIALSLIVLFAIISIMLFQGMEGKPLKLEGLTVAQHAEVVARFGTTVQAIERSCSPEVPAGSVCPPDNVRYAVLVQSAPASQQVDLAKQLLILVGTLMTSVTSYYFATRDTATNKDKAALPEAGAGAGTSGATAVGASGHGAEHADGCDVAITDPTADQDLPAARGGVARGD